MWRQLIVPLVEACDARQLLEIGSESGLSTRVILNYLRGGDGHLHSIDPAPQFDAAALARDYAGAVTFYRDASLHALPKVPPVDLALIDGDHNWYTVFHELQILEACHAEAPLLPLILVHDSGWPYGRRDLYYDPAAIPAEYRHAHARKGIPLPGAGLGDGEGMNAHLQNAIDDGGPRNGVLTAIEDFIAASRSDWMLLQVPLYFGVSILVPEQRLRRQPRLAAQVARLQEQLAGRELIALAEQLRLAEGVQFQHVHRELEAAQRRIVELEQQLREGGSP